MKKIIITKKQLEKFDGGIEWAVADLVADHLNEKQLSEYSDGKMTDDTVTILNSSGEIVAELEYEIEEELKMTNKKIMTRAWEIARQGQVKFGGNVKEYFAESLKMSWKIEKGTIEIETSNEIVGMKKWFVNKNFEQNEAFAINNTWCSFQIERETEKAYKLIIGTDYGTIHTWAPKSVCMTAEQEREETQKKINAWESGLNRNEELRQKAIDLGIKGIGQKTRMKTATLERKIAEHQSTVA